VEILLPASSERADVCTNRRIRLIGLRSEEAEIIGLLADILGWDVDPPGGHGEEGCRDGRLPESFAAVDPAVPWPVVDWDGVMAVQDGLGSRGWGDGPGLHDHWAQHDPGCETQGEGRSARGLTQCVAAPRLLLRQAGNMIRVEAADADLAAQLARLGLDRLVLPIALLALEDLFTLAG
jgi:hypothetical protein